MRGLDNLPMLFCLVRHLELGQIIVIVVFVIIMDFLLR
jgi:hypothetical protein